MHILRQPQSWGIPRFALARLHEPAHQPDVFIWKTGAAGSGACSEVIRLDEAYLLHEDLRVKS